MAVVRMLALFSMFWSSGAPPPVVVAPDPPQVIARSWRKLFMRQPLREIVNAQRNLGATLAQYGPRNAATQSPLSSIDLLSINTVGVNPATVGAGYARAIGSFQDDTVVDQVVVNMGSGGLGTSSPCIYAGIYTIIPSIDGGLTARLRKLADGRDSGGGPDWGIQVRDSMGQRPTMLRRENYALVLLTDRIGDTTCKYYAAPVANVYPTMRILSGVRRNDLELIHMDDELVLSDTNLSGEAWAHYAQIYPYQSQAFLPGGS